MARATVTETNLLQRKNLGSSLLSDRDDVRSGVGRDVTVAC
jgi:hypothetical protein